MIVKICPKALCLVGLRSPRTKRPLLTVERNDLNTRKNNAFLFLEI